MADENLENGPDASEEQKRATVREAILRTKERQLRAKENAGAQDNDASASRSTEDDDSTVRDRRKGSEQRTRRRCCRGAGAAEEWGREPAWHAAAAADQWPSGHPQHSLSEMPGD